MPSNGEPNAFIAAPVVDQGMVIGVLVGQLSVTEIDRWSPAAGAGARKASAPPVKPI
jgi:C4-dicarboxylate-specific signal transduction histidine kinase